MTLLKDIEKFLLTDLAADMGIRSLGEDDDLIEQRIIDSLGILKLITFLESNYSIKINDEEILPENFHSLNSLTQFVEQKRQIGQ